MVCRNCAQEVDPDAGRCPHCGASIGKRTWLWYLVVGITVLGGVMLLLIVAAFAACLVIMGNGRGFP
jgi:hypothetical protein